MFLGWAEGPWGWDSFNILDLWYETLFLGVRFFQYIGSVIRNSLPGGEILSIYWICDTKLSSWGWDSFNILDLWYETLFLGVRFFQYIGSVIRNSLPLSLSGIRLHSLRSKLKTHLFSSAYWSVNQFLSSHSTNPLLQWTEINEKTQLCTSFENFNGVAIADPSCGRRRLIWEPKMWTNAYCYSYKTKSKTERNCWCKITLIRNQPMFKTILSETLFLISMAMKPHSGQDHCCWIFHLALKKRGSTILYTY